jgi:hypothetical protein
VLAPGPAASRALAALPPLCAARPGPARPPAALPIRPGRRSPLRQTAGAAGWCCRRGGPTVAHCCRGSCPLPRRTPPRRCRGPRETSAATARVPTATPRRRRERLRRYGEPPGGRGGVAGNEEEVYGPATTAPPRRPRGPLSRCLDNACLTLFNGSVNDSVRPLLSRQCRRLRQNVSETTESR